MTMKKFYYYILAIVATLGVASCDYLDIVPDEIPTEKDAFADEEAALRYIYSCYAFMPMADHGSASLDFLTGDEVITSFDHETFAAFNHGEYTASNPVISYWDTFFQGLRQCQIFLNNVDGVPGLSNEQKTMYKGEAKFLLGYYHFLLVRCYGATILIKNEPGVTTPLEKFQGRENVDTCVNYVCHMFDEAAAALPATRKGSEYGRATSVAAKAFKAKMLVYAASPLLNSDRYKDVVNPDGTHLFAQKADPSKWTRAKEALKEAIDAAEAAGHELYKDSKFGENKYPEDPTQRILRYELHDAGNSDIIFADCRQGHQYGIQNKSLPGGVTDNEPLWNDAAPTWNMLNRFYTENGLPVSEDPEYKGKKLADLLKVVTIDDPKYGEVGQKTIRFNLGREPRFYAWVAYQGGYYEISNASSSGAYSKEPTYKDGRLVTGFVLGENSSRGYDINQMHKNKAAYTCYLNKKGVDPDYQVKIGSVNVPEYPWPLMRLADLYLLYAEACVETNDLETAKTYLNKIRTHAGIPTVEKSWEGVAELTQSKLREIVRQERMVEMYMENQNFWDMRRWLLAEKYFDQKVQGLKSDATSVEEMAQIVTYDFERHFDKHQYLLPIPQSDLNKNPKVVQNPGY